MTTQKQTTEESIISKHVEPFLDKSEDNGDNGADNTNADGGNNAANTQSKTDGQQKPNTQGNAPAGKGTQQPNKDAGASGNQNANAKPGQQPGQQQDAGASNDALIDRETGQVIVQGGVARRRYEYKAINNFHKVERQLQEATTKLQAFEQVNTIHKEMGMQPQEAVQAAQVFTALKKDPVKTIGILIAEAKARGFKLEDLAGQIDVMAISNLIDERLKPVTDRFAQQNNVDKDDAELDNKVNRFFTRHPEAKLHEGELAKIIIHARDNLGEELSPEEALIQLGRFAINNGYDLSQPLAPQIAARNQQGGTQQNGGSAQRTQSSKPLPLGKHTLSDNVTDADKQFDHTASTQDIVKDAMRKAGYNI